MAIGGRGATGRDMNGTLTLAIGGRQGLLDSWLEEMIEEFFLLWGHPLLLGNKYHRRDEIVSDLKLPCHLLYYLLITTCKLHIIHFLNHPIIYINNLKYI